MMTNDEAIKLLRTMKDEMILAFDHDRKVALEKAIEALKAQLDKDNNVPTKQLDTDDCISRKWCLAEYDRQHVGPPGGARKIIVEAPSIFPTFVPGTSEDTISRQAAIDAIVNTVSEIGLHDNSEVARYGATFRQHEIIDIIEGIPSAQPESTRTFVELVVEYPDPELCTYKEYKGKPYYSIKYIENGETYVGYGTYDPKVLSQYLKEYFISSAQPEQSTDIQDILQYLDNVIHPLVSPENWNVYSELHDMISNLPSAQPKINNQINLCDTCTHTYPDCPAGEDDILFGNGAGNDNICACGKYEVSGQTESDWIPCSKRVPDDLAEVNITYLNTRPEPYYDFLKGKPFAGTAVYYKGRWYWYSAVCVDYLGEYGFSPNDEMDDYIKVIAWKPLPEPYIGE